MPTKYIPPSLKEETNPKHLYEAGCHLIRNGQFKLALTYVETSIKLDPVQPTPAHNRNLGWIHYNLEDWPRSKKFYQLGRDGYDALPKKPHVADYLNKRQADCQRRLDEVRFKK